MTEANGAISEVIAATVRCHLPNRVVIGDRTIAFREYAVVAAISHGGGVGLAYGLTRGGPVADIVNTHLSQIYRGTDPREAPSTLDEAVRYSPALMSSGVGLRAVSLCDIATWDLAGKLASVSLTSMLGGPEVSTVEATWIVGYPPNLSPDECAAEVSDLASRGITRFKAPFAPSRSETIRRLEAIREAAPDAWLAVDAAWTLRSAGEASAFLREVGHLGIQVLEDPFLPGGIEDLIRLTSTTDVAVATGDDQGGMYYPEALLRLSAADILRFDATCMGGVSRSAEFLKSAAQAGVVVSPHIFGTLHTAILTGLGYLAPCEWSSPGRGVDPVAEAIPLPEVNPQGTMTYTSSAVAGVGTQMDVNWLAAQDVSDRHGLFRSVLNA